MRHYFTEPQFRKFWNIPTDEHNTVRQRSIVWYNRYYLKYQLHYWETDYKTPEGFYGVVEGSESHINLFLLQL